MLKEFEDLDSSEFYSDGFELYEYGKNDVHVYWFDLAGSKDPEVASYLERLIPLAQATHSGSFYALWRCDDREDLATLPVVFFGDEGGLSIVGRGLLDLFQLLAIDSEDFDPEGPEDGHSPRHEDYLAWLESRFGLTKPDNPASITYPAAMEYEQPFAEWLERFVPEEIMTGIREELGFNV